MLFILAAIAAIGATVLLANDRRNLKTLSRLIGIPLPAPVATLVPAPAASAAPQAPRSVSRWPWPGFALTPGLMEPVLTAADMCSRRAAGAQEMPAFTESEQRGWECSLLRDGLGANDAASLFLQARGLLHEPADNIRVKFNLAGGGLDGDLATQALTFFRLASAAPRDQALSENLTKMLTTEADFYFFAGYHSLTFKQEIGNPGRFNFIGTDRTSKAVTDRPRLWAVRHQTVISAPDIKTGRLPRLLTLPAGSD